MRPAGFAPWAVIYRPIFPPRWIVRHCLRNPAGSFSVHRLYQDLRAQGHGLAKDAVHAMVGFLTDAFLISALPLATDSERKRNSNPRKFYPADPGLIHAFDASGRSHLGHALETAVANELERRKLEIGYVKTAGGREVDFLVRHPSGDTELVQVCADLGNADTRSRELEALVEAGQEYPRARRRVIALNGDGVSAVTGPGLIVQPAHEWLLQQTEAS